MRSFEILQIFPNFLRSSSLKSSFHLWWKENLLNHHKVSKYYEHDCRYTFLDLCHVSKRTIKHSLSKISHVTYSCISWFWSSYMTTTCSSVHSGQVLVKPKQIKMSSYLYQAVSFWQYLKLSYHDSYSIVPTSNIQIIQHSQISISYERPSKTWYTDISFHCLAILPKWKGISATQLDMQHTIMDDWSHEDILFSVFKLVIIFIYPGITNVTIWSMLWLFFLHFTAKSHIRFSELCT